MNLKMQARLSVVLAAACGIFGLLALLFWLGVGSGYRFLPPSTDATHRLPSVTTIEKKPFNMPEFGHFAEITQRPLLSDDRLPIPPGADQVDDTPEAPPVPLQVQLTGIIITPELRMALLKDNTNNKAVSLKEGMPLPGNQSAWLLVEIQPRKVVFKNDKDETSDVELIVSKNSGPPSKRIVGSKPQSAPKELNPEKEDDANESLRERIEARRKQLREQAEKMRAQQQRANQNKQEQSQ